MPPAAAPPVPRSFAEYLRSFGPGFVVVLTWLGSGDIVSAGVSGGNYGYSLMWAMVFALLMRYLFVTTIAKYQLSNPRGEGVLDGLARLHPGYAPFLFAAAILVGHVNGTYMVAGSGELSARLAGFGQTWQWGLFWVALGLLIVFRPIYAQFENVFKFFMVLMTASLVGTAVWVGFDFARALEGTFAFRLPPQQGPYGAMVVAMSMVGAVGGSLMNLVYPYFLDQKGWRGPQYRKVQRYDFLLAVMAMIVFNLAVWTLGAELLHGKGRTVAGVDDLAMLLAAVLGQGGRVLFLVGVFAAVYTSLLGNGLGLGCLASHAWQRWRSGALAGTPPDYRAHPVFRFTAVWILVSPLPWVLAGKADFVSLTLLANTASVILIPALAGGLWWITASARFLDAQYRNRWWENAIMATLFVLALYGTVEAGRSVWTMLK